MTLISNTAIDETETHTLLLLLVLQYTSSIWTYSTWKIWEIFSLHQPLTRKAATPGVICIARDREGLIYDPRKFRSKLFFTGLSSGLPKIQTFTHEKTMPNSLPSALGMHLIDLSF